MSWGLLRMVAACCDIQDAGLVIVLASEWQWIYTVWWDVCLVC